MTFIAKRNFQERDISAGLRQVFMRQMVWIKTAQMETWACSECAWTFSPLGPPQGADLGEMMENYERQRDNEHASHVCTEHPRARSARDGSGFSRSTEDPAFGLNPVGRRGRNDMRRAS